MARKKRIIGCGCKSCMFGMHHSWGKSQMQATIRSERRQINQALKKEDYDKALDVIVSYGYLD